MTFWMRPVLLGALLTLAACGSAPNTAGENAAPTLGATLEAQASAGTLVVGQTRQLNVTVNGVAPTPGQITWTTSNPAVATVSQGGLVTATGAGSATIRAALTARPSVFLDFSLTVTAQAASPAPAPTTPTSPTAPSGSTGTTAPSAFAQRVLELTNAARAQARSCGGVNYPAAPALTWNAQLAQAAQAHAADMAAQNYFSHTSLDGRTVSQRVSATGYAWRTLGENIAAGQTTPESVVSGWLASSGHCRNIMNAGFKELGVGYAQGGSYGVYWVQDFGAR